MSKLLSSDISEITKTDKNIFHRPYVNIFPIIHTEKKDLFGNDGIFIEEIIEYRDYANNFSDYIEIKLKVYQGTFYYDIYPYLDNIEITITKDKFFCNKNEPITESEKYKAYFLLDKNPIVNQNITASRSDLNSLTPLTLTLQLLDRSAETIRIKTIQGHFDKSVTKNKSLKIADTLKSIYSEQCNKILIDNKPSIERIEIEEPDNKEEFNSLIIPSYTQLINLVSYIQNNVIGVYNSDIGLYLQNYKNKKTLFIYSLYDKFKFDKTDNKIIIYIPSDMSFSTHEKTYNFSNNILRIISNPNSSIQDSLDTISVSEGTGIRLANASSYMRKPVEITPKGPSFRKSNLNTEISLYERKDGLNFARKPSNEITYNIFAQISKLKKSRVANIRLVWSNSYSNMIYPGAGCKLIFESKSKVQEITGVIHKVITKYENKSTTPLVNLNKANNMFSSSTSIEICLPKE